MSISNIEDNMILQEIFVSLSSLMKAQLLRQLRSYENVIPIRMKLAGQTGYTANMEQSFTIIYCINSFLFKSVRLTVLQKIEALVIQLKKSEP